MIYSKLSCPGACMGALYLSLALITSGLHAQESSPEVKISAVGSTKTDYVLLPADILQIKVFQEEDLTREVSISQERTLSLPLIGTVEVAGKTVRQAEELIRQLYDKDFLVNPQVSVIVLKYAERTVNVMGSVNQPQAVLFPPERGLTLLDAIARAGGFNRYANQEAVVVTRTDEKGQSTTFTVNVKKLIDSASPNQIPLQVGDVVTVREKFL